MSEPRSSALLAIVADLEGRADKAIAASERLHESGDSRDGAYQEGLADGLDHALSALRSAAARLAEEENPSA